MIVKVCGMRDAENIRAVEALGVDWMGFIFHPGSPRFVAAKPSYMPLKAKRVGVFVTVDLPEILEHVREYGLDIVQLHGGEAPGLCLSLREKGIKLIKAFSIASAEDLEACGAYEGCADWFLFDTKCSGHGGSGVSFDWSVLSQYCGQTPFILSGGICHDSVEALSTFSHPKFCGIDLNSRFESAPAVKDIELLQDFLTEFGK